MPGSKQLESGTFFARDAGFCGDRAAHRVDCVCRLLPLSLQAMRDYSSSALSLVPGKEFDLSECLNKENLKTHGRADSAG
ncbi:hypothetical protein HQ447_13990 [bacterium]|nr:hypothetical protein [bacterium]